MSIKPVARFIYGLTGVVFLAAGATVLLLGTGLVPEAISRLILEYGGGNDGMMHLVQESCTLLVFMGLVNLWCIFNDDRSLYLHWAMTAFWALFALVHWFDYRGHLHAGTGQLIDTAPFALWLIIGVLRLRSRRRAHTDSPPSA